MECKKRDYYFDNLKGFLIFAVVLGNTLECINVEVLNSHAFVLILYLFHMPLFTFISGYFAKKSRRTTKEKVKDTVKIYLIVQCLYSIFYIYLTDFPEERLKIFYPNWTLWYLFSLIFWYILSDYIEDGKKWLIGSIAASLLIGLDITVGPYASISRTIFFLPFFVAGYSMNKSLIDKMKNYKLHFLIGAILMILITVYFRNSIPLEAIFEYSDYKSIGLENLKGMGLRLFHYLSAFIVSGCIMAFGSATKSIWSYFGKNSLVIYIIHSGVIQSIILYNIISITSKKSAIVFIISVFVCVMLLSYLYIKGSSFIGKRVIKEKNILKKN